MITFLLITNIPSSSSSSMKVFEFFCQRKKNKPKGLINDEGFLKLDIAEKKMKKIRNLRKKNFSG